jgi:hypothetical protein
MARGAHPHPIIQQTKLEVGDHPFDSGLGRSSVGSRFFFSCSRWENCNQAKFELIGIRPNGAWWASTPSILEGIILWITRSTRGWVMCKERKTFFVPRAKLLTKLKFRVSWIRPDRQRMPYLLWRENLGITRSIRDWVGAPPLFFQKKKKIAGIIVNNPRFEWIGIRPDSAWCAFTPHKHYEEWSVDHPFDSGSGHPATPALFFLAHEKIATKPRFKRIGIRPDSAWCASASRWSREC